MEESPLDNLISLICQDLKELNEFVKSSDFEVELSDPAVQKFLHDRLPTDTWIKDQVDALCSESDVDNFVQENPLF